MTESLHEVLFVEDVTDTRDLVEFSLRQDGFGVTTVRTAGEGLDAARQKTFSLILIDIGLPDKDGLELCREIRGFDPKTPILFYTAFADLLDEQEAAAAGAQGYLRKPEDTVRLSEVIRSHINQGGA